MVYKGKFGFRWFFNHLVLAIVSNLKFARSHAVNKPSYLKRRTPYSSIPS